MTDESRVASLRFAGKTFLVTGAARGIGEAVTRRLAGEGARIAASPVRRAASVKR
ncbi:3-oxoacyl-[acyl-carrier protein] reductase [Rhizobiales bacterium GAS188]|nr:3-oxoacyl-[acyl-carrier protein] reductase [Rhizobiales bacterium GAS188]